MHPLFPRPAQREETSGGRGRPRRTPRPAGTQVSRAACLGEPSPGPQRAASGVSALLGGRCGPGPLILPRGGGLGSAWRSFSPVGGARVRFATRPQVPAAPERCWGRRRPEGGRNRPGRLRGKGASCWSFLPWRPREWKASWGPPESLRADALGRRVGAQPHSHPRPPQPSRSSGNCLSSSPSPPPPRPTPSKQGRVQGLGAERRARQVERVEAPVPEGLAQCAAGQVLGFGPGPGSWPNPGGRAGPGCARCPARTRALSPGLESRSLRLQTF